MATDLSRRLFLGMSISTLGAFLLRCGGSSGPGTSDAGPGDGGADGGVVADAIPFGIWSQMQTAVEGSPDHLTAAAARVVAAKDPQAIYEFVRDNFLACPPDNIADVTTYMRWGTRGILRSGMGTPREKVELLASLYAKAGFTAQVMSTYVTDDATGTLAKQIYLQQIIRAFAPTATAETIDGWLARMKTGASVPTVTPIDPSGTQQAAIVNAVTQRLPSGLQSNINGTAYAFGDPTHGQVSQIPFVSVTINGKATNANVLFPSAQLGDALPASSFMPSPADPASPAPTVTVSLSMATTLNPLTQVQLVSATYPADQLAGRQLLAQFLPGVSSLAQLETIAVQDIFAFRPLLLLAGPDVNPASDPSYVSFGPTLTLQGDLVATDATGTVIVNGQPLYSPSQVNAGAVSKVASLSVVARAGSFPNITLYVQALDASAKPVLGLPASAFSVSENAAPVPFLETAVPSQQIRVLLVLDYDANLSNGDDPLMLAQELVSAVVAAYPNAGVQLPFSDSVYTDSASLLAAINNAGFDSDNPWTELADAASRAPAVVVMVSDFNDGDFSDSYSSTAAAEVSAGAPVIAVPTEAAGDPGISPLAQSIVAQTGGQLLSDATATSTINAVLAYLKTFSASGMYTLNYTARTAGMATREVEVAANGVNAAAMYTVPTGSAVLQAAAIAGLYLTVNSSTGNGPITRVLGGYGGYGGDVGLGANQAIDPSLLDEAFDTLFSVTMLSFEAGSVPFSVQIDDLLTQKLSLKPLYDALEANDLAAATAAAPAIGSYVPLELRTMTTQLPASTTTGSTTYDLGLRVVACSQRPRFKLQKNETRVDLIPLFGMGSLGTSATASFTDALTRTAGLAAIEAGLFPTSTASALAGVSLISLSPGLVGSSPSNSLPSSYDANTQLVATRVLNEYANCYRIIPAALPFTGFWAVDAQSGALIGVLPDGTGGGGSASDCMALTGADAALNALGILGGLAGVGWAGSFAVIGQLVAEVFLLTAAIFGGATPMNTNGAFFNAALCGGLNAGLGLAAGALGSAANAANNALSLLGAANAGPEACPGGGAAIGC